MREIETIYLFGMAFIGAIALVDVALIMRDIREIRREQDEISN